jgi:hypothetical protein
MQMSHRPDRISMEKYYVQIRSISSAWVIDRVFCIWHDTDARPSTRRYGARDRGRMRPRPNANRRYMRSADDGPPNSARGSQMCAMAGRRLRCLPVRPSTRVLRPRRDSLRLSVGHRLPLQWAFAACRRVVLICATAWKSRVDTRLLAGLRPTTS